MLLAPYEVRGEIKNNNCFGAILVASPELVDGKPKIVTKPNIQKIK